LIILNTCNGTFQLRKIQIAPHEAVTLARRQRLRYHELLSTSGGKT